MTIRPLILLVDDDVTLLQVIAGHLHLEGFEAVLAQTAAQAIQSLQNLAISLVVVDIFMPDQDGMETIGEVRARWPSLPIIAMSGGWRTISPDTILETAKALGAQEALAKPFDRQTLVEAIRRLLPPA
ncbi:MAG: response regulator [Phenylobacterium sp.]|uniref:response regulator n=1 Tax=Phenylobacterium sp. TaxID=1871053 RepID=UPI002733422F|nr:response regulator [Phenylobacterium sp.]MDP1643245.1 response regulator [Phenylobacterium sp.]MDP3117092.1 response regulator [Phenylobacterium sp.]